MRWSTARHRRAIVATAVGLLLPTPGLADRDSDDAPPRRQRSREILLHIEKPSERDLHQVQSEFRIHKRRGLEYRRGVTVGERDLVLSLQGPAMPRRRLGLAFEVRF